MKKLYYLLTALCFVLLLSCQDEVDVDKSIENSEDLSSEIIQLKSAFEQREVSIRALEVGFSIDWESPISKEEYIENKNDEIKPQSTLYKYLFPIELEAKPVLNSKLFESPKFYLLVQQLDNQIDFYVAKLNQFKKTTSSVNTVNLDGFSGSAAYYHLSGELLTKDYMESGKVIERLVTEIDKELLVEKNENQIEALTSKSGELSYRVMCGGGGGGGAAVGFPMSASRLSIFPMNCGGGGGGSQGGWVEVTTYEYWDWFESENTGSGWSDWTYTHSEWIATTEWQYVSGGNIDDHIGCVHTGRHIGGGGGDGPSVPPHSYSSGPISPHEDMMICMEGGYPTWHCCSHIPTAECNEDEQAMYECMQQNDSWDCCELTANGCNTEEQAARDCVYDNNCDNLEVLWEDILLYDDVSGSEITNIEEYLECFDLTSAAEITLYVDQPKANSRRTWRGNPTSPNVGHTFLSIKQGGQIRVFGFYPDGSVNPITSPQTDPRLIDDSGHSFDVSISTTATSTQLSSIIDSAIDFEDNDYNLNSYNCTDFGLSLFSIFGFGIADSSGSWPGGGGSNPGDLGEDIRNMPTSPDYTINSSGGSALSNSGTC